MKTNSKLFAFAVMAFMLVGAFAIVADQGGSDAAEGDTFVKEGYTYTILTDGETHTVSIAATTPATYTGTLDLSTLTEVDYNEITYTITGITASGFRNAVGLTAVNVPSSITNIGDLCFHSCSGITTVTWGPAEIPYGAFYRCTSMTGFNASNLISIGESAFSGDALLAEINLSNATSIGKGAFYNCTGLTQVDLTSATNIGENAFKLAGLTTVAVPSGATVGPSAFRECPSLASVTSLPATLSEYMFHGCTQLSSVDLTGVTTIAKSAFYQCALSSVDLSNVTEVGNQAFKYNTDLTTVTVPSTANMGTHVFQSCTSLTSVTWGPGTVPMYEFEACESLASFDLSSITEVGDASFRGTALTSVTFNNDVTIGKQSFKDTQVTSITFSGENNTINLDAFPPSGYVYANGAVLDDWSPALIATPAGTYVATYEKVDDSWSTQPSINATFNYGEEITYTEGTATSGNEVTYKFVGTKGTVYVESETVPTDAGTYKLHAFTAKSDQFNALSNYYEFEILPAENSWTTPFSMATTEFTYPNAVTYTPGVAAYGEVYYVITDANNDAVDGWPTEVGTYSVYAVVDETVNYNGLTTAENPIQFTIALPSGDNVATIDGTTYSTIAAAQEAGLAEFIVAADMRLVEDVVLASGQSIIFVTGATFTGSIEYTTDAETPVTSVLRAINLVAGSPIVIAPGSIELSGTIAADYLVLSGEVVVTANTTISAGTMLVISDDAVISNLNDATLTIEAGAYYYNEGANLPTEAWFVNNGTEVAADYIGDNEVSVAMTSAGQVYLTLDIEDAYVGDITGASFVRVSWTVTDSEDAAIKYTGEATYANDADAFGILVGNLDLGDYTISMHMYYVYEYTNVVRSISVDKPFTVLPQDIIIGAYYGHSAYHAVLYNVFGENLAAGTINVDAFTAKTGELSDGTEYQYIDITSTLTAEVDGTTAGGAYDLEGTVDIDNMVALQPWYQINGSSAKLYAFETVAYSTTPAPISEDVDAYNDLAAVVSIAVGEVDGGFGEVDGGVWVYAVEALDGATLTAVVDDENTYTAEVTLGDDGFKFFDFETDFVDENGDPVDISDEDIAYFLITAVTMDGDTVTDAHLSLVVLDYQ